MSLAKVSSLYVKINGTYLIYAEVPKNLVNEKNCLRFVQFIDRQHHFS